MRRAFGHLLAPTDEEVASIWQIGSLAVDANVLLDLYRHQPETRDALLAALDAFRGRLWLPYQAAFEFLRNRATVAASIGEDFDEAAKTVRAIEATLRGSTGQIQSRRAIPREISRELERRVLEATEAAQASISSARKSHEAFVANDPILSRIFELFDGCVGVAPTEEEVQILRREGERRIRERIPPGYSDSSKEGERAYGDYFVWSQVLKHAKDTQTPMIFVTSDGKEDWWARVRGKTTGPRQELLAEAMNVSGRRILLLQTETFLVRHAALRGAESPDVALADIRALARARSVSRRDLHSAADIVRDTIEEWASSLVDTDERLASRVAETNATGFELDDVDVTELGALDFAHGTVDFCASLHFTGATQEDEVYCGDGITAEVLGQVHFDGTGWRVADYELSATVDDYSE